MNCVIPSGPAYIPSFVKKWERGNIYDLDACEVMEHLWITVYQTSNAFVPKLADFSKVMPMFCVKRWERSKKMWIK
jgi:hypothetical protein